MTIYGCAAGSRTARVLQRFDSTQSASLAHVAINAGHVAYVASIADVVCGKYAPPEQSCSSSEIDAFDLSSGRRRLQVYGDAQALVLTDDGWVAWLSAPDKAGGRELWARDSAGERRLDAGAIDPSSLAAGATKVFWTNAGAPASATLS